MEETNPLVGTWRLVSWQVMQSDGTVSRAFGPEAVGYLIYSADGYMSAQIMDSDRQQSDPSFPQEDATSQTLPEADRARAYDTYLAYSGPYTVSGHTVIHHVSAGLTPGWTGSEQVRTFRFEGDHLILGAGRHVLTWERAVPRA